MPQISDKISEKPKRLVRSDARRTIRRGTIHGVIFGAIMTFLFAASSIANATEAETLFVALGEDTRAPVGWVEFCNEHADECPDENSEARDILLTPQVWKDLVRVNRWVNKTIKPMTDLAQWGVVEKWSYPDTGYGDCEDYVLLKRRMLIEAGWPRAALLITVVREQNGNGHAVLTVKTNKGEFVLDNQNEEILLWSATTYRFVKRQSQENANIWVTLDDPRPAPPITATSR